MSRLSKAMSVVQAVRHAYMNTGEPLDAICQRFDVYVGTVRQWRIKYGWPKRQGIESRTIRPRRVPRLGELAPHPLDLGIKSWRCCSRLNTGTQCGTCGHRPAWAA